jgi:hypothetical protein
MLPKLLPRRKFDPGVVAMERLMEGLLATVRLSNPPPRSKPSTTVVASVTEVPVGVEDDTDLAAPVVAMFATADINAASPP